MYESQGHKIPTFKRRKNGFFINLNRFCEVLLKIVIKKLIWLYRKGYILSISKPNQMKNMNVKVIVKVTNGTFSKKAKKQ